MHVKDIMSKEVFVIDKDQNMQDALKLMKKHKVSRLPVVNMNGNNKRELVGIITEKDIALRLGSSRYGNLAPSHFHISTVMSADPLTIESTKSIGTAAKIMNQNKIGGMPVVDNGEVVGIITKTDFIKICEGVPYNNTSVKEWMRRDLITIGPEDRLVHARRMIIDEQIGRLLVMSGGELEGIVSARDVAKSMISFRKIVPDKYQSARIRNLIVEDIMTQNVRTVAENDSLEDASKMMMNENFSGIPVTDGADNVIGIITKTDIMNFIIDLEEVS